MIKTMSEHSPKPILTPLAMSTAPKSPTRSPLPIRNSPSAPISAPSSLPRLSPRYPVPKLRLEIRDIVHDGADVFYRHVNAPEALLESVATVLTTLYLPKSHIPPTRSVTLILRSMAGVAYTEGIDLDNDHKEIHLSLDYIAHIAILRRHHEIMGVLVHEMVHCWQWNALGTAPGGLIEGIADFVRLRAGLEPPHWKKEAGGDWDAGYQHTGYFLDWIERTVGDGSIRKINDGLKDQEYAEDTFWRGIFGKEVGQLWAEYTNSLKGSQDIGAEGNAQENEDIIAETSIGHEKPVLEGKEAPSYLV